MQSAAVMLQGETSLTGTNTPMLQGDTSQQSFGARYERMRVVTGSETKVEALGALTAACPWAGWPTSVLREEGGGDRKSVV